MKEDSGTVLSSPAYSKEIFAYLQLCLCVCILFYVKHKCFSCSWMRLGFLTDPKGKVPVKVVARTFASGKAEKMVYQCLSDLGLPSGKVILILLL